MRKINTHKIGSKFAEEQKAAENDIFKSNELETNIALSKNQSFTGMVLCFLMVLYILFLLITKNSEELKEYIIVLTVFPINILLMISARYWIKSDTIKKPGYKYFLIVSFTAMVASMNIMFPKHAMLGWPTCIVLAAQFYNPKVTRNTYFIVLGSMLVALYLGFFFGEWDCNLLNAAAMVEIPGVGLVVEGAVTTAQRFVYIQAHPDRIWKVFAFYFLVRALIITLTYTLLRILSARTFKLLKNEADETALKQKSESEKLISTAIQSNTLPRTYPDTPNGEVFALMNTAKEVGGDFYDFFYIDESHLGMTIADVSGKGVPAALYMMKTQALIKSLAMSVKSNTALIVSNINHSLCEANVMNMFVTCWFGILDYNTGVLKFTNAGHNPPVLKQGNEFKFLKSKVGLVLGALNSSIYEENQIQLKKGDKLFLYTDGVTEAHNNNKELYSEPRLLEFLNNNIDKAPSEIIPLLREDIDKFANGAEQFDDITMLMLEYRHSDDDIKVVKTFEANKSNNDLLMDFIDETLMELKVPFKTITAFKVSAEEIFVNIASYAYQGKKGDVEVQIIYANGDVYMVFKDSGVEFNPLLREDPNINAKAEERGIGGLGILMVKNLMDRVSYKRLLRQNYLTIKKKVN